MSAAPVQPRFVEKNYTDKNWPTSLKFKDALGQDATWTLALCDNGDGLIYQKDTNKPHITLHNVKGESPSEWKRQGFPFHWVASTRTHEFKVVSDVVETDDFLDARSKKKVTGGGDRAADVLQAAQRFYNALKAAADF